MQSNEIREIIAKHLALRNKLQIAAKEVLENGDSIMDVATKYGLDYQILDRKIDIMKRKEEFNDKGRKYEAAKKEIIEGRSTYNAVSNIYGLNAGKLYKVVKKTYAQEKYEYDRKINSSTGFTYLREKSLLKVLKNWARYKKLQGRCSCQLCALEKLLKFAYEFAQRKNIECPFWDHTSRQASIDWLIDFEMRNSDEIFNSFDSFFNRFEQIVLETNMSGRVANYNF